jgi:four helix bundle protein
MNAEELRRRTKLFGLDVIRLASPILRDPVGLILGKQLIRCATSVGANYRAPCLAQSTVDTVDKLKAVETEADEAVFWLELIAESKIVRHSAIEALKQEARELYRIMAASVKTLRKKPAIGSSMAHPC